MQHGNETSAQHHSLSVRIIDFSNLVYLFESPVLDTRTYSDCLGRDKRSRIMWEYRVMRRAEVIVTKYFMFGIHEVCYNKKGERVTWTSERMSPHGITIEGLRSDLRRMSSALKKPVLDYKTGKEIK